MAESFPTTNSSPRASTGRRPGGLNRYGVVHSHSSHGNVTMPLRWLRDEVGGRNKLARLLGVTGPYLGRVLRGESR